MTRGPTPSVNRPPYHPFSRSNSALYSNDADQLTARRGSRHDLPPAVHSLWTPVWTQCGCTSTDGAADVASDVVAAEDRER